jgi:transposase
VIGAVEAGMSRNAAARRFGVSIASAVRWMDEYLRTGRTAPKPRGGDRRSGRIEAQAELLMAAIEETPDITLAELRERLIAVRGERYALSTIHDFYRRHGITFKKDGACQRAGARGCRRAPRSLVRAAARARPFEALLH